MFFEDEYMRRVFLSFVQQRDLILNHELTGKSGRALAVEYDISKNQACRIIHEKEAILKEIEDNPGIAEKSRLYIDRYEELNATVYDWFCKMRMQKMPISGPMLQEAALMFAQAYNFNNFKASNGWLESFRLKYCISCKKIVGDADIVDSYVVDAWKNKISELIDGYSPNEIYNLDETGLLFEDCHAKLCVMPRKNVGMGNFLKKD